MTSNIKIKELTFDNIVDLNSTELEAISGGSVAANIGEMFGYFCGYLYVAGPRMVVMLL
jgi:hypothetical protein